MLNIQADRMNERKKIRKENIIFSNYTNALIAFACSNFYY